MDSNDQDSWELKDICILYLYLYILSLYSFIFINIYPYIRIYLYINRMCESLINYRESEANGHFKTCIYILYIISVNILNRRPVLTLERQSFKRSINYLLLLKWHKLRMKIYKQLCSLKSCLQSENLFK